MHKSAIYFQFLKPKADRGGFLEAWEYDTIAFERKWTFVKMSSLQFIIFIARGDDKTKSFDLCLKIK